MSDYGYSSHRRVVFGISGLTRKGDAVVLSGSTRIIENRVNGTVRSVTVLDGTGPQAKAVHRLTGASARY